MASSPPRFGTADKLVTQPSPRFGVSANLVDVPTTVQNIPPSPTDSWGQLGLKFLQNAPTMFKQVGGGLLQALAETEPQPPLGIHPNDPQWQATIKGYKEIVVAAREAGTLPGMRLYGEATADLRANAPNVDDSFVKRLSYDVAQGIVQMVPALTASALTRSPALGATIIGTQVYGPKYAESRAAGRSEGQATADAVFYGLAEAIPEMIPLGILIKPGGKFLSRTLAASGAEGIQEMVTEVFQSGYDAGIINEDMTFGEAVTSIEYWQGVGYAGLVGAAVGGGLAIGSQPFRGRDQKPKPPPDDAETFTADQVREFANKRKSDLEGAPSLQPVQQQELDMLRDNADNADRLASKYGIKLEPTGERQGAVADTPPLSQADIDSPISSDLIQEGHEIVQDAMGGQNANKLLDEAGLPPVNSRINLESHEGPTVATVVDAWEQAGVRGAKLQYENGRTHSWSFEALKGRVTPIVEEASRPAAAAPTRDANRLETATNRVGAAAKLFGNLTSRQAVVEQGFDNIGIDRQRQVLSSMRAALHDSEVFRSVVEAVPIDVMNDLVGKQFSPEYLLSNPDVLLDVLAADPNQPITTFVIRFIDQLAATVPDGSVQVGARPSAEALIAPLGGERDAATGAGLGEGHAQQSTVTQQAAQRTEELTDASQIQRNQEGISRRRQEREGREDKRRKDLQFTEEARPEARDRQAQAAQEEGRAPEPAAEVLATAETEIGAPLPADVEPALAEEIAVPRAAALRELALQAGWAEVGGRIIRKTEDVSSPDYSEIVGRTKWLPKADWWPGRPGGFNEKQTANIIEKGINGKLLGKKQREYFQFLTEIADEMVALTEYQPTDQELTDVALEQSTETKFEVQLVARAIEIDEDAVEQAAKQYEDDDAGFLRAIKIVVDQAAATDEGRPSRTQAEERDLLGEDTRQAQALADEARRRDDARNQGQESIETGEPGDLFSQARRQVDIDDVISQQPPDTLELQRAKKRLGVLQSLLDCVKS